MTEHQWGIDADSSERCAICGVRRFVRAGGKVVWQRKKGGHWRDAPGTPGARAEPIPDCKEKP